MTQVYLEGRPLTLDPARSIAKGGEADIFDIGGGRALKLWKPPEHPDLYGMVEQQQQARARLLEHQHKLRAFPDLLPARVVRPETLATDLHGQIVGYAMRLLAGADVLYHLGEPAYRAAVTSASVVAVLRDLAATVGGIHRAGVVIGDFNDLNVMVVGSEAHLVDADSFQFGRFLCRVFTERFVDPLLCVPDATRPLLAKPFTPDSDWYAFNVMLLRALLCVDPYGGVFKPKLPAQRIPHTQRPLSRITVFHPEVRYPRPALPPDLLPDDLLQYLHRVFEQDLRGAFPATLLEALRFTRCAACGTEHARAVCPHCHRATPAALRQVVGLRGRVTCTLLRTRGRILHATVQDGRLAWLVHENGSVRREDGSAVLGGDPQPQQHFRTAGADTLVGDGERVAVLGAGRPPRLLAVDRRGQRPLFDTNHRHTYWVRDGWLEREGTLGPVRIGRVLAGQTWFFVGPSFGLGFYRAGQLSVGFVFDAEARGLNDSLALPPLRGQLLGARCAFTSELAWLFTSATEASRTLNRCTLFDRRGTLLATTEAEAGDGSWLGTIDGACATGASLLVPTDAGVVRVEAVGGALEKTQEFPDTEPFVDAACTLLPCAQGLYVVSTTEIRLLQVTA